MKAASDEFLMFDTEQLDEPFDDIETERQIHAMTFEEMLRKVRTASLRDPLFRGETGRHFHAVFKQKRHDTPPDERAAISEKVGF